MTLQRISVIDSHTGGEPTRVIVGGAPELPHVPLAEKARMLRENHDWLRRATCLEPRGHEAMVGALLTAPFEDDCTTGVIFFNNTSTLHMCVHGAIGVVATLAHMGRITPGICRLDTPVGVVEANLHEDGSVTIDNVPSYRHAASVAVSVPGYGEIRGDIAWGGNWFFLIDGQGPPVQPSHIPELTQFCTAVRTALESNGITGADGALIDHIEVFGPSSDPAAADSRNFVLCPGLAYDRSPCGTGTSAKLACLHAEGKMAPGEVWRQAGILNSVFQGSYRKLDGGRILPSVTSTAWISGEATLILDPADPFRHGFDPASTGNETPAPNP